MEDPWEHTGCSGNWLSEQGIKCLARETPRIAWGESLNKGFPTLGWPVGISVAMVSIHLIDWGNPSHCEYSAPLPRLQISEDPETA